MIRRATTFQIDRVVLTGSKFSPREVAAFRASFEGELTRLLRAKPLQPNGSLLHDRVSAPAIPAHRGAQPARLGEDVARSLYTTLGGSL